ncbi:hypothetical protein OV079_28770 [Nannocystis pusilla]|uniref:DUF2262 domain-containing protein n=1 Tax=Nannocystis pusilla TaxID=889268 RepID=A0A9X3ESP1_9BACT|nr:hypothetical protein [Nannocystis pusilla]MCY1009488.1 hypothetical protein [Nannocystis pusilla]
MSEARRRAETIAARIRAGSQFSIEGREVRIRNADGSSSWTVLNIQELAELETILAEGSRAVDVAGVGRLTASSLGWQGTDDGGVRVLVVDVEDADLVSTVQAAMAQVRAHLEAAKQQLADWMTRKVPLWRAGEARSEAKVRESLRLDAVTVYAAGEATLLFSAGDLVAGHTAAIDLDPKGTPEWPRLEG